MIMPTIKSSADLRNNYNKISTFCHNYSEPVFITKNGKGDLAVMSIEAYEELTNRFELYGLLKAGIDDEKTRLSSFVFYLKRAIGISSFIREYL